MSERQWPKQLKTGHEPAPLRFSVENATTGEPLLCNIELSAEPVIGELLRRYNEHDALVGALRKAALRNPEDGPCFCTVPIPAGTAHHLSCQHIRSVLAKAGGR